MPRGFVWLIAAQFLSALADNALLIVTMAWLLALGAPAWWAPLLKFSFTLSYVLLAPFVGALADRVCKRRLMVAMNALKLLGALALLAGLHPLAAFALVGLGASAYAPAKYGLLTESTAPAALVAANGWVESAVVLSVLLGVVLGGALVAPAWLQSSWVQAVVAGEWLAGLGTCLPSVSLSAMPTDSLSTLRTLQVSLGCVVAVYVLAAFCHWGIRPSGATYARRGGASPRRLWIDFRAANRQLWQDRSGGLSLAVTSVFWGLSALMQFAVLLWATGVLALGLDQAAYLQGTVAGGVVVGAVWVATRLRLRHALRVLALGLPMGALLVLGPLMIADWRWALPVLLALGALGGVMVVPMNALLQHRGHRLLSAGQSIAVQGFNENLGVLIALALYAGLIALQVPVQAVMVLTGLSLAGFVGLMMSRRRRGAVAAS
ncbi:major facilitator transporter [Hylemonella gracilis str. Niagara R]|uniref:Major facilitator transporter n=1 Tax=Hylemonella gracilis str. Niagara R TaxID=1458275 RepID=A0A016XIV8_9BURK|nr:major facilitator transporter [Hylemonella gracilis str. Niagara R]